jgi:hypothetical protein
MPLILGTNSIKDTGYDVANSLRFDDGGSEYLQRTPSSTGNRKTWTFSTWIKRSGIGLSAPMNVFGGEDGASRYTDIMIGTPSGADDTFWFKQDTGTVAELRSTLKLRDPSAWYHLVFVYDSTNGTADDRMKMYVNGVQLTSFVTRTNVGSNVDSYVNTSGDNNYVGVYDGSSKWLDGYLCETTLIDGTALTPTSFGEYNEDSPTIWQPIDVSGLTFGTNGFYLDFEDSSALGNDVSGNNNDFTVNNLTATDQSTDTCTNNFATLNPLYTNDGAITYSEGNLKAAAGSGSASWTTRYAFSSIGVSAGRWYVEAKCVDSGGSNQFYFGVGKDINTWSFNSSLGYEDTGQGWGYYANNGNIVNNGNDLYTSGNSYTDGDIISMELDLEDMTLDFYKNGVKEGYQVTSLPAGTYHFAINGYAAIDGEFNFGSPNFSISSGNSDANGYGNFEYSVPSGHYALNTKNLAEFG